MKLTDELLPCPFCGSKAQMTLGTGPFLERVQIDCTSCRNATWWWDEAVAVRSWNRRAAPSDAAQAPLTAEQRARQIGDAAMQFDTGEDGMDVKEYEAEVTRTLRALLAAPVATDAGVALEPGQIRVTHTIATAANAATILHALLDSFVEVAAAFPEAKIEEALASQARIYLPTAAQPDERTALRNRLRANLAELKTDLGSWSAGFDPDWGASVGDAAKAIQEALIFGIDGELATKSTATGDKRAAFVNGLSRTQCNAIEYFVTQMRGVDSAAYVDMFDAFRDYINSLVRPVQARAASQSSAKGGEQENPRSPRFLIKQREERDPAFRERMAAARARAAAPQAGAPCPTCNGHGVIGGPSYYSPDEGGVPCPDCSSAPQAAPTPPTPYHWRDTGPLETGE